MCLKVWDGKVAPQDVFLTLKMGGLDTVYLNAVRSDGQHICTLAMITASGIRMSKFVDPSVPIAKTAVDNSIVVVQG